MTPFSNHGTIRQEDIVACNVARSAITRLLALEARCTAILVTNLISKTQPRTLTIADLWIQINNDPSLISIVSRTDAHVDAYMQFAGWVKGARSRVAYAQTSRLVTALGQQIYAHRFRNSDRLTRLHLLSNLST